MKSTIKTLVVAMVLGTASMAASAELSSVPVSPAQEDTTNATAAISAAPLHALNRLNAQTLAEQEMTDQELKAVEGGAIDLEIGPVATGGLGAFLYGYVKGGGTLSGIGYVSTVY